MTTSILDFRIREEMAGAVLKEVAALEPAERLQEAESLSYMMSQAVQALEDLWRDLSEPLRGGVSPADAATLARILIRSANLIGNSLELLARESSTLEEFSEANMARLRRIKAHAASLRRLVEMPTPAPEPHRLNRSLEQIGGDEAVEADDLLAELKG